MDINFALFCTFSLILLFAGFRVITAKSPVAAALNLVLAFANASCIWMLLKVEFLAISLVLVYVGAVMVLFLFVVMMLDINVEAMREGFWKHFPLAGLVGAVIAVEMIFVLYRGFGVQDPAPLAPELAKLGNAKALGVELYSKYLYPVEIAAVILLVAIIAAIALTLRQRKDSRFQSVAEQIKVKKADRLRIVQMQPVKPQSVGEAASAADVKGQA